MHDGSLEKLCLIVISLSVTTEKKHTDGFACMIMHLHTKYNLFVLFLEWNLGYVNMAMKT